jgi:hypothetical protein
VQFQWEQFTGRHQGPRGRTPRVSLYTSGSFVLNRPAYELLGHPASVRLLYDAEDRAIGVQAAPDSVAHALPVKPSDRSDHPVYLIHAKSFLQTFEIAHTARRAFDAPRLEDGVLVLNLDGQGERAGKPRSWTEFTGARRAAPTVPRATIQAGGAISLNGPAYRLLDAPSAVHLLYDSRARAIGLRRTSEGAPQAFPVKRQGSPRGESYKLYATSFLRAYDVPFERLLVFDDVYLVDDVLVLELNQARQAAPAAPRSRATGNAG